MIVPITVIHPRRAEPNTEEDSQWKRPEGAKSKIELVWQRKKKGIFQAENIVSREAEIKDNSAVEDKVER